METTSHNHPRFITIKIMEQMSGGDLDPQTVADAALSFLSEAQVRDMARANEWFTCQTAGCNAILDEDDPAEIESEQCPECQP